MKNLQHFDDGLEIDWKYNFLAFRSVNPSMIHNLVLIVFRLGNLTFEFRSMTGKNKKSVYIVIISLLFWKRYTHFLYFFLLDNLKQTINHSFRIDKWNGKKYELFRIEQSFILTNKIGIKSNNHAAWIGLYEKSYLFLLCKIH